MEGDDPLRDAPALRRRCSTSATRAIRAIQAEARRPARRRATAGRAGPRSCCARPRAGPGPKTVDGEPVEGTFRAHQVPVDRVREDPEHLAMLEAWMRSYRPGGAVRRRRPAPRRAGRARAARRPPDGRQPARQRRARAARRSTSPTTRDYALPVPRPATELHELDPPARASSCATSSRATATRRTSGSSARTRPTPTGSATSSRWRTAARCCRSIADDDHVAPDGRVMEILSEHCCQGWLEGYLLTGRHGLFASYEAFAMVSASMTVQHAKWLQEADRLPWRAPVASLNILLTLDLAGAGPQRLQPPGPGADRRGALEEGHGLADLPAARRQLPALGGRPLLPQPRLREPDRDRQAAAAAVARSSRPRASTARAARRSGPGPASPGDGAPDVVLAAAGDVPTLEIVAAAWLLRHHAPELRVRVGQRGRPHDASSRRASIPHGLPDDALRGPLHREHARWCSRSTATSARSTS